MFAFYIHFLVQTGHVSSTQGQYAVLDSKILYHCPQPPGELGPACLLWKMLIGTQYWLAFCPTTLLPSGVSWDNLKLSTSTQTFVSVSTSETTQAKTGLHLPFVKLKAQDKILIKTSIPVPMSDVPLFKRTEC